MLAGKPATTHWASIERMRTLGTVDVREQERFVVDGNVVTSAGISAGIDMALWLVQELWGRDVALQTQKIMEYAPRPPFSEEEMRTAATSTYSR